VVENEIRSNIATSSFICSSVSYHSSTFIDCFCYELLLRLETGRCIREPPVIEWFRQDCAWSRWNRTHWHRCNPVCGCDRMSLEDIAFLLPHHLTTPSRGYVIEFPINTNLRNPHRLRRFTRPQPNSLSNIAGAVVQQHLRNFFVRANYPDWHYNDFKHAQTVLKNDYNVPPKILYSHLTPLDYRMCHCDTFVNIITSLYEPQNPILAGPRPEREWA